MPRESLVEMEDLFFVGEEIFSQCQNFWSCFINKLSYSQTSASS
jgi:hypothetical protein